MKDEKVTEGCCSLVPVELYLIWSCPKEKVEVVVELRSRSCRSDEVNLEEG